MVKKILDFLKPTHEIVWYVSVGIYEIVGTGMTKRAFVERVAGKIRYNRNFVYIRTGETYNINDIQTARKHRGRIVIRIASGYHTWEGQEMRGVY